MSSRSVKIKNILVSQPEPTSEKSPYFAIAEKYNLKIDFRPFIKIEGIPAREFREQKITILDHSAIVFTARTGIDHFFRMCEEMRVKMPDTMRYICTSESIALYLQNYIQYRKRKVSYGSSGKINDLLPVLKKHSSERFLLVLSDVHKDDLTDLFDKNNLNYSKATMYRTVSNDFKPDEEFNYCALIFFSPQGVSSLLKNFPDFQQNDIKIGCLGPTTAKAITEAGLRLDFEAPRPDAPSITAALEIFMKENHKNAKKAN